LNKFFTETDILFNLINFYEIEYRIKKGYNIYL